MGPRLLPPQLWVLVVCLPLCGMLLACDALDSLPGKPDAADRFVSPSDIRDPLALFAQNCSGCHGQDGRNGPARSLNEPFYWAFASDQVIKNVIREGRPGTSMPAFGMSAGGPLAEAQIDALVTGLRDEWGKAEPGTFPPYASASASAGDASRGKIAFQTFCGECHGGDGRGGKKAGSVVDSSYLALISDQGLRTTVVVGRRDLEMPSYRNYIEGRAMSHQEISDTVSWLLSRRVKYPGQPYPDENHASASGESPQRPGRGVK